MYPAGGAAEGRRLDGGRLPEGGRGLPQGRHSLRHRPRARRPTTSIRPAHSSRRSVPQLVDAKGNLTVKTDAVRQALDYYKQLVAVLAARRPVMGRRLQQQVAGVGQGRADHEPAERLGGGQARCAAGRRAVLDPRLPGRPEGPLRAVPALLLGHLELRQEQVRRPRACSCTCRSRRGREDWWRRAVATTCRPSTT